MIKINQLKLPINSDENLLDNKIKKALRFKDTDSFTYEIVKKSLDARKKDQLMYIYSVLVDVKNCDMQKLVTKLHDNNIMYTNNEEYEFMYSGSTDKKVIIVGSGPAGLFCGLFLARAGYCPVIYERGMDVDTRTKKVSDFWNTGILDTGTNVQFGEGGAGTFSDGKLNTAVKDKTGRIHKVLKTFVEFGADNSILYTSKPHIGTDVLTNVVKNIRLEIEKLGGLVKFNSCVTNIFTSNNHISGIEINNKETVDCDYLVLATGHSARDTFTMLAEKGTAMEAKAFAVGMRLEHPQKLINDYTYGNIDYSKLPAADYKVTAKAFTGHGVYSFCMCPGGYVVNASSEKDMLCVNGMSYKARDSRNANSAIVVTVEPSDFGENDILSGMNFQRKLEGAAYRAGRGNIPCQLNSDFKNGNISSAFGSVIPCTKGKTEFSNLREVLPEFISESVIDGMKYFDKIIKGYNIPDAVFSGVESRTSSPVRILRNDMLESINISSLYPCGEGAGYAGGITSAAVDGIKVAEAIANKITGKNV